MSKALEPAGPSDGVNRWGLVDLFAGCGGASAGFLATGAFDHLWAADNDRWAAATYEKNLGHEVATVDLLEVAESSADVWAAGIRARHRGPICLVGGPPCQGFSSHVKVRGDSRGRNTLYGAFVTLAIALEPEVVVIENVPDLFATRNWELFADARSRLSDAGYRVRARILNFAEFGVPQERFRAVVIASRADHPEVRFPAPTHAQGAFSSVQEWIGELSPVASGEVAEDDAMHQASRHSKATLEIIRQVPADGGNRPIGVGPECLDRTRTSHGGYTDVYGRLAWQTTAPTITARCRTPSCGRFIHPEQHRGLTAREAALLQTFPSNWHFVGPFDDRFKQIGNAVPPLAARRIAEAVLSGGSHSEAGVVEIGDEPIGSSFSVLIPGIRRRGGRLAEGN
ncbi:DNA cytosine methyltransferase [Demequina iriomotensis]|uniref:DNA cytosine methyltransferase n=1 Tax=Demequina iriomotensis TaxID=1536641 RepID=UPI000A80F81A|nr:DNA cytosine methyltransferase [Demequina iriomotensis]